MSQQKNNHEPVEFRENALYSQDHLLKVFGISKSTIGRWHEFGLKQMPTQTRVVWYHGKHLIEFFGTLADSENN